MKRILTHKRPDLDAIVSAWLAQDFLFAGEASEVLFVNRKILLQAKQDADCLVDVGNAYQPQRLWFDHNRRRLKTETARVRPNCSGSTSSVSVEMLLIWSRSCR